MKRNPVHSSGRKFAYKKVDGLRLPRKPLRTKQERFEFSKTANYMERVEAMRPYFRDVFSPDAGYNLHDVDQWTPAQKSKITKYYRVMAPRLAGGPKVVKRYRRKDHLESAIDASLQEQRLKGQTAAIFSVDPGQELEIKFTKKHVPIVRRGGVLEHELRFNMKNFVLDWKAELDRVLDHTDARLFKVITGANRSYGTYNRMQLIEEIARLIEQYSEESLTDLEFDAKWFGQWLNGIIGLKGTTKRKQDVIAQDHAIRSEARRRQHNKDRAKRRRIYRK